MIDTSHNSSFSSSIPGLQIAWDSTSMSELKTCARKYFYSIIMGYTPKQRSFHLDFGIWYHEALETYDREKAAGKSHDEATAAAVRRTLKSTWNQSLSRPWISNDPNKNRFTLIRTIIWYLDHFADDAIETIILSDARPAVELSFRHNFPFYFKSVKVDALICGHLDRLGTIGGQAWVVDRKTTKHAIDDSYFNRYTPDNQMSTYSMAGKVVYNIPVQGVIVDAAQVMVTFSRFRRGFANRTEGQINEWIEDTVYWMGQAEKYAEAQYWPMNDKSCFNFGGCPFRGICSRDPSVRETFLNDKTQFVKRTWDPLQTREV